MNATLQVSKLENDLSKFKENNLREYLRKKYDPKQVEKRADYAKALAKQLYNDGGDLCAEAVLEMAEFGIRQLLIDITESWNYQTRKDTASTDLLPVGPHGYAKGPRNKAKSLSRIAMQVRRYVFYGNTALEDMTFAQFKIAGVNFRAQSTAYSRKSVFCDWAVDVQRTKKVTEDNTLFNTMCNNEEVLLSKIADWMHA